MGTVLEILSVNPVNDLDFGLIIPGENKTISPEDAEAGRFDISGEAGREVQISFDLPDDLSFIGGPEVMPVSYSTTSAITNTTNDASSGMGFNPDAGSTTTLNAGTGELYVFIGATVEPSPTQFPGNYEGTITLTIEYTGN